MVTKSKLKMALAAEKGLDFGKLNLKKREKAARKGNMVKGGGEMVRDKKTGKEDVWEDLDGESEDGEEGGVAVGEDEGSEEEEVNGPRRVCTTLVYGFGNF